MEGLSIDAIFINHGDLLLPFEWPVSQAMRRVLSVVYLLAIKSLRQMRDRYFLCASSMAERQSCFFVKVVFGPKLSLPHSQRFR